MKENGVRETDPLTIDQLKKVKEAAAELSYRHRLIAHIVPHSGLTRSEFTHLHRDWLTYRTDDESDSISETVSPDSIILTVPEESPCVGTLKIEQDSGRLTEFVERDEPCAICQPDEVWEPENRSRANRRILIRADSAVDTMYWWFQKYDTLPFSPSPSISRLVRMIGNEAGLSRDLSFMSLRRTYGVLLIARGADREMVSEWLGVENRYRELEPLYSTLDRSVPETGEVERSKLLQELRRLADDLGHPPTFTEIEEQGEHAYSTYRRRFGGLEEAYEAAGLDSVDMAETRRAIIPEADLIEELRRLADDLGRPPTVTEIEERGEHAHQTYLRRFGSLEAACEAANLDPDEIPDPHRGKKISEDDLLRELRRLADDLGHPPSAREIKERGEHAYQTYRRRFGGLEAAREAAGLDDSS